MAITALYDVLAPAKLNLFLHVIGRRPDGYHLIESVFVLIDWYDTLHVERIASNELSRVDLTAPLPADDLCLRAARALQLASGTACGARITIDKQIPSGAGMGGGSSDAASALLALNRLWGLDWPLAALLPIGLSLGADVPFFLQGRNAWVEGIGEVITPIDVPPQRFAVLKPAASVMTKDIFTSPLLVRNTPPAIVAGFSADARRHGQGQSQGQAQERELARVTGPRFGRNDLQPPAMSVCAEIGQAASILEGAFGKGNCRMTGSGSAVFAWADGVESPMNESTGVWPPELAPGWASRMCSSLEAHPLLDWARFEV